jgi:hypothetical protein
MCAHCQHAFDVSDKTAGQSKFSPVMFIAFVAACFVVGYVLFGRIAAQ